jgi:hypothetical protein
LKNLLVEKAASMIATPRGVGVANALCSGLRLCAGLRRVLLRDLSRDEFGHQPIATRFAKALMSFALRHCDVPLAFSSAAPTIAAVAARESSYVPRRLPSASKAAKPVADARNDPSFKRPAHRPFRSRRSCGEQRVNIAHPKADRAAHLESLQATVAGHPVNVAFRASQIICGLPPRGDPAINHQCIPSCSPLAQKVSGKRRERALSAVRVLLEAGWVGGLGRAVASVPDCRATK